MTVTSTRRQYVGDSLVLETEYDTADGTVKVTDFMSPGLAASDDLPARRGAVRCGADAARAHRPLRLRVGRAVGAGNRRRIHARRGNDALRFHSPVPLQGSDQTTTAEFTVREGQRRGFSLAWYSALEDPPPPLDTPAALRTHRSSTGRSGWSGARIRVSGATRSCAR